MDLETSLKKLFSLHNFGIKLGLENTLSFLDYLGNPQDNLKCIHIAGSNGKGSTASFIASILQESGFKIGLYTSPHFVKFNERIVINGRQIDDQYIADFINEYEKYIDEHQLTFFEVTTALAFKYFSEKNPDYCVIETGLGGRLDATNVLSPLAVVITSISLEHTNVLGNTIEQIAYEKAAIIKDNSKVFIGLLNERAEEVILNKCNETKSRIYRLKDFLIAEKDSVSLKIEDFKLIIEPPLKGIYQKNNSALASLVIYKTLNIIDDEKFKLGIKNVTLNTGLQGRYEYYHKSPTIIFDSAHNPEGIENFLNEFKKEYQNYKSKKLLFGVMRDKSIKDMLKQLSEYFDEIFLAKINYERAAKPEEILLLCNELNIPCKTINNPEELIQKFKSGDKDDCLVLLGSMYLLGEIKQRILERVS